MELKTLIKQIEELEKILTRSSKEMPIIDNEIRDVEWEKIAIQQSHDFYIKHKAVLEALSKKILHSFTTSDSSQRGSLLSTLRKTEHVQIYISTNEHSENSQKWFNEQILGFILFDLGRDTRDALLELGALIALSKKHNVDLGEIIKSNIELANTVDWHGMGSTRSILDQVLSNK